MDKIKPLHLLKIGLGINMLMHGLSRVSNVQGFVEKMSSGFADSFLRMVLVKAFLTVLPFAEALVGLLIFFNGKIGRLGLIAGGLLISVLIFGSTAKQDWNAAGQQMIYLITFGLTLHLHDKQATAL
ncbi:DoxX family protein [Mucilaginibacter myungsuensis]|uniref:DoxX family protein n=1 Tax=Mucilaginibacter myungsuensis TaxID=649104 RepID=A0A929KTB1_9SPHI|nr:DoxX family protein [Mucilaginibacter myungsuensis]MBE9661164.1 DoxX family protein [Mucilaginibacter myungsuensis]MDN3597309.1 hypothetical protein [Mucilaginibacter myungsuensis]